MAAPIKHQGNNGGSVAGKLSSSARWLPTYMWQRISRRRPRGNPLHLIFSLADHFEPSFLPENPSGFAPLDVQRQRLAEWCRVYPKIFNAWHDSAGFPFVHTYFYPAEQYEPSLLELLAEHCHAGWGEIEIQLHHGVHAPDTAENTSRQIIQFRESLVKVGCLSRAPGDEGPRYGFVHGNWALANSAGGRFCGVDQEMQILAETGCFADFTLPSAPNPAQVAEINALYECALPLDMREPHRRGHRLRAGFPPQSFPLIFEGPLMLDFTHRAKGGFFPRIENSALTGSNPPSMHRLQLWIDAAIAVEDRPDWIFIKLHCHGMDPTDRDSMLGESVQRFLFDLTEWVREKPRYRLHFVTGREMVNIALAASDGHEGSPSDYRDYWFRMQHARRRP